MLIRTQDKKSIVNAIHIYVSPQIGSKKRYLFGRYHGASFLNDNSTTLGVYESDDAVMQELDAIAQFFAQNPNGIYQMR